jgi:hypothetical protein
MVVLGIADPDRVARQEPKRAERHEPPAGPVHAGRHHHDRALVEDHSSERQA